VKVALSRLAEIAQSAAAIAKKSRPATVESKCVQDFVTDIDRHLEREIADALAIAFPNTPSFGEEGLAENARLPEKAFLIDPLDGTGNWISNLPFSAVSIAYIENGQTILAIVAGISNDVIYMAETGSGAWLGEERLRIPEPTAALLGLSTGVLDAVVSTSVFRELRRFGKIRNLGSQALQLCAVAQGSLVFNVSLEARLWDDAAGRLVAAEAGARYSAAIDRQDFDRPAARQRSLCAHPEIFDEVAAILSPILFVQQD
jgi:myo-inositol-1(or 4)-monophosphatase